MITGYDYVLYSNTSPVTIERAFVSLLKARWPDPVIEEFDRTDDRLELFFAKNSDMNLGFDDTGYALNEDGEGCFMLLSNRLGKFESAVTITEIAYPANKRHTEPYESYLILNGLWEYTLVLPSPLENCVFSQEIYSHLKRALSDYQKEEPPGSLPA